MRLPAPVGLPAVALLVAACSLLPPEPRGTGPAAPVPEVVRRYPWMADVRRPPDAPALRPGDELAIAEDIDRLLTGEFNVYAPAAGRLIRRGEAVLPFLGHAAERHPAPAARKERLLVVARPILLDLPTERVLAALSSTYPRTRGAAAAAAGERGLDGVGQRLVELLEDPELSVRRAAIAALRRITGEFLEYRADDPPAARAAAAAEWQRLWRGR